MITSLWLSCLLISEAAAQSTFGGNAQHTANYSPAAQNLNALHWTASIDLNNTGGFAHYGAPVITPANTIFVPIKTGSTGGFQISVFNAANGAPMYSLNTDYIQPAHNWILPYQPVLASLRCVAQTGAGLLLPPPVGCPERKRQRQCLRNSHHFRSESDSGHFAGDKSESARLLAGFRGVKTSNRYRSESSEIQNS